MPLWIYWAVFFAVIGLTLLAAAWLEAREGASPSARTASQDPSAKPPEPFERPAPKAVEAIEAPGPVDPFARTMEIERVGAPVSSSPPTETPLAEREDDGPTRE